jgi:hypothetical protein
MNRGPLVRHMFSLVVNVSKVRSAVTTRALNRGPYVLIFTGVSYSGLYMVECSVVKTQ